MSDPTATSPVIFLVVTPSRNGAAHLDQAIASVVLQRGPFEIRYHVQDGQSEDGSREIVEQWAARLRGNDPFFRGENPIDISFSAAPDRSMYEALQTGFETLVRENHRDARRVVMTWINSDDRLAPDAFRTVADFLSAHPEENWVTGLASLIREDGSLADVRLEDLGYAPANLLLGEHDGRSMPFVMQEGTFWTLELWRQVEGINQDLRYAGDWDLWRRMARYARPVTLRSVLAHHRRRPGQLSEDLSRYWAEVDELRTLKDHRQAKRTIAEHESERMESACVAVWRFNLNQWSVFPRMPRSIAAHIRKRREGMGWTREQLAENVADALTADDVALLESGQGNPDIDTLRRLAQAFECPLVDLLPQKDKKRRHG